MIGSYLSSDIIDEKTGKIFFEAGYEIDELFVEFINEHKINRIDILKVDNIEIGSPVVQGAKVEANLVKNSKNRSTKSSDPLI